jgi:hypothetical protein
MTNEVIAASFTGTVTTIRIFEVVSLVLYLAALTWVIRTRTPLYLGAFIGATLVWAFDWTFSTNGFFHVTFNEHLIPIPGLNNQGITEPISIPMNYGIGFALPAILWARNDAALRRRFGAWRHLMILAAGAVGVGIYEIPVVHVLGIWTYHQRPEFTILGFPWSNFWFAAGLLGGPAILLAYVQRWVEGADGGPGGQVRATDAAEVNALAGSSHGATIATAVRASTSTGWGGTERVWRGVVLGAMPIWAAFYLSYMVQLFWYAAATPWITPYVRPF